MNKLKANITRKNYGGGGGKSQETVESIPEWMRPAIQKVGAQAEGLYQSGALSQFAGASPLQQQAFTGGAQAIRQSAGMGLDELAAQQARLRESAQAGAYDTSALKDKAILEAEGRTAELGKQYGTGGTLGSARQAVGQGASDAATKAQFATIDYDAAMKNFQNKLAAEQALGGSVGASTGTAQSTAAALAGLGSQERGITKEAADMPWTSLQRYASTIYGNPARQQAVSGGGGGK